jgi:Tol biopolymer transport system component
LPSIQGAREEIVKVRRRFSRWQLATLAAASFAILAAGAAVHLRSPARPAARSEWVQLTNFPDPVSQPALSKDGRMLTFVRGPETFAAPGEIYVKTLPNGEPVQLTRDGLRKMSPVFSPDGSRIAYTVVTRVDQVWDTWVVLPAGGQARLWLRNASGLVWLNRQRLLFSEIEHDIHMGVVMADENGGGRRSVYLPAGRRGMVHRSCPSPDRRWAVLVEMDRGVWRPCRLVPMDGGSTGRPIGPPGGACTVAGWSPDGKWIYLNSSRGGTYHIWRQRFPDGKPEQLTSGPTEEEGIAVTPDGGSLITSVGLRQSVVFVHGPSGDRPVSREGFSYDPKFTPDGKKLCYRILKGVDLLSDPSELRVVDLDSGQSEPLLPGLQVFGQTGLAYDVSPDGKQVVAAARDPEGKGRLWLAALDQQSRARQISNVEGDHPHFGVGGEIIFRATETASSAFLYRVNQDGSQLRKVLEQPVAALRGVSPDRRWLVARVQTETSSTQIAFPLQGGIPIPIHTGESW